MGKIVGYGAVTAAGNTSEDLWNGLCSGSDFSLPNPFARPGLAARACLWPGRNDMHSFKELLLSKILRSFGEAKSRAPSKTLLVSELGVIFASTKGCTEDVLTGPSPAESDTLTPVLREFMKRSELQITRSVCVSNSCASTLSAVFLANQWIRKKLCETVVIVAADAIGPFVTHGFQALRATAPGKAQPFSSTRQGFYLGDGAVTLILSEDEWEGFPIEGASLDAEGFAVTRPSVSGESLKRAFDRLPYGQPDLIIAHGTATPANDETEDNVFSSEFAGVPVTSTKWSIGHTLGASGGVDIVTALEIFRNKKVFPIANTPAADPAFRANYLTEPTGVSAFTGSRIYISSLGFGGIHGALSLGAAQ